MDHVVWGFNEGTESRVASPRCEFRIIWGEKNETRIRMGTYPLCCFLPNFRFRSVQIFTYSLGANINRLQNCWICVPLNNRYGSFMHASSASGQGENLAKILIHGTDSSSESLLLRGCRLPIRSRPANAFPPPRSATVLLTRTASSDLQATIALSCVNNAM